MAPARTVTAESTITPTDAARGCLLAGAAGDALGAAVEFMSWKEIKRKFGDKGVRDFAPAYGGVGLITDDTQMTLFTAEGMIHAYRRWACRGICHVPGVIWQAYQRWLLTQGVNPAGLHPDDSPDGPLIRERALFSRRAPGNTCLTALQGAKPENDRADNDSKGCGGVMRVAPCALIYINQGGVPTKVFESAIECAQLTHGHPTGYLSAGAFAVLVYEVARGNSLDGAADRALALLKAHAQSQEVVDAIERARALARSGEVPGPLVISRLGGGWIAEEALAITLYCSLVSRTLEDAMILAVNHDGDSDSTGSMAGNLMGAIHGEAAIPRRWLEPLELRDTIAQIGEDLAMCMTTEMDPDSDDPVSERNRAFWQRWLRGPI